MSDDWFFEYGSGGEIYTTGEGVSREGIETYLGLVDSTTRTSYCGMLTDVKGNVVKEMLAYLWRGRRPVDANVLTGEGSSSRGGQAYPECQPIAVVVTRATDDSGVGRIVTV